METKYWEAMLEALETIAKRIGPVEDSDGFYVLNITLETIADKLESIDRHLVELIDRDN